jgi:hypothetical protein
MNDAQVAVAALHRTQHARGDFGSRAGMTGSSELIAVGTVITDRPPLRSVRVGAVFRQPLVCTSGATVVPGMLRENAEWSGTWSSMLKPQNQR